MSPHPFHWLPRSFTGTPSPNFKTPHTEYGELFEAIQKARIFPDSKTFADSIPKKDLLAIKQAYKESGTSGNLAQFIEEHFLLPEQESIEDSTTQATLSDARSYIDHTWKKLTRGPDEPSSGSSLLPLPHRYVVPGGRFREVYYWDSYFTMLGLRESNEIELLEDMVKNFAHLIRTYGFVPNSNRSYHLSRSQPPFFPLMVRLLADIRGEEIMSDYLEEMLREHEYWMRGATFPQFKLRLTNRSDHVVRMTDGEILNRYCDAVDFPREESFIEDLELKKKASDANHFYQNMRAGAESGWDYSSRWFGTEDGGLESTNTLNVVPIDLNCVILRMEELIAETYRQQGDTKNEQLFRAKHTARAAALQKYCWSSADTFYFDYLLQSKQLSPHRTLAGVFPLFAGLSTPEQAEGVARVLTNTFLRHGGLVTTLNESGEQWDSPNGWAPLQYIAVAGLERYGHHELAQLIAERWCKLVAFHFKKDGTMLEKYNVEDPDAAAGGGEYELQRGFGWTNGVTLYLLNNYKIDIS